MSNPDAPDTVSDPGIPMLTEVLPTPRYASEELPASLADVDWAALALRVQENTMERMLRRTQQMLEDQVQTALRSVIERATEGLALQLQDALTQTVRDLVSRAVTEELTRVHAEIASREQRQRGKPGATPDERPPFEPGLPHAR